jgi:succinate dehydrogenase hydrophobic anchor subunit
MKTSRAIALLSLLFIALSNHSALACSACYGDTSGSKMGDAATVGIFAMVVIMFVMLGTLFLVGWHFAWKAKQPLPEHQELLAELEQQSNPEPPPLSA